MYEITTSLPRPKLKHEHYAEYSEINTSTSKEILENFKVASFFRRALNLEEDGQTAKQDKMWVTRCTLLKVRDMNAPS